MATYHARSGMVLGNTVVVKVVNITESKTKRVCSALHNEKRITHAVACQNPLQTTVNRFRTNLTCLR